MEEEEEEWEGEEEEEEEEEDYPPMIRGGTDQSDEGVVESQGEDRVVMGEVGVEEEEEVGEGGGHCLDCMNAFSNVDVLPMIF